MSSTDNTTTAGRVLTVREMAFTALMTAVICVLGPIAFPLPFSPVPISLGTLAIYLAVYVLGMKRGLISCVTYLLLGAAGLPVFTGFTGGLAKMAGPTGGYLIGYLFMAAVEGFFIDYFHGKKLYVVAGMVIGTAFCYLFGSLWLAYQMHLTLAGALALGAIPYLPGDAAKIAIALSLGSPIRYALKRGNLPN